MARQRINPGPLLALLAGTCGAMLWVTGFYHYWITGQWGTDEMASAMVATFWPLLPVTVVVAVIYFHKPRYLIGMAAWVMTMTFWAAGLLGTQEVWVGLVAAMWYPVIVGLLRLRRGGHTVATARRSGAWVMNHQGTMLAGGALVMVASLVLAVITLNWYPFVLALVVALFLWAANWIITLAKGFNMAGVDWIPGEIRQIPHYDGDRLAAPQHIHWIGIFFLSPLVPQAMRPHVGNTPKKPGITEDIGSTGAAWAVVTAPLWAVPVLYTVGYFTGTYLWFLLWPAFLIPVVVYVVAMHTRTMYGLTENKLFVTYPHFHFFGVETRVLEGKIKSFEKSLVINREILGITFGLFDPGLLKFSAEDEEIFMAYLPDPMGFRYALAELEARFNLTEREHR